MPTSPLEQTPKNLQHFNKVAIKRTTDRYDPNAVFDRIYQRYGTDLNAFFQAAMNEARQNALEKCSKRDAEA
jgi:hypothetical protein